MLPSPVYFKNSLASLTLTRHGLLSLTLVSLVVYATLTFLFLFPVCVSSNNVWCRNWFPGNVFD